MERVGVNAVLRSKKDGEIVIVTSVGRYVSYRNGGSDGEVLASALYDEFDVLSDPSTQDEIEAVLRAKVLAELAEPGLYDCGISYVAVSQDAGEVTFQWFQHATPLSDVLMTESVPANPKGELCEGRR